ncbi:MAG: hypothetical protein LBV34_05285 [Nocardiopsaceae bacterium]|jgi:hypothetical protein|nr:hypothetical protein [Nocardiopsaceae bacterium]
MTDDDLLEGIRSTFADVHLGTPVDAVLTRGRSLRRRRSLIPVIGATTAIGLTGAFAAAAGAPGHQARLAAWTVTARPGHMVELAVRRPEALDPKRIAGALRHAGVPAVASGGMTCRRIHGSATGADHISARKLDKIVSTVRGRGRVTVYRIDVSAMPPHSAIDIFEARSQPARAGQHGGSAAARTRFEKEIVVYRKVTMPGDHGVGRIVIHLKLVPVANCS